MKTTCLLRIVACVLMVGSHTLRASEALLISSDEHNFMWPIPAGWEKATPLTKSQYVVKSGAFPNMTCGILVNPAGSLTNESLIRRVKNDPEAFFKAIKKRFPDAKFIRSELTKLGSHDAVLTESEYTMKNLGITLTARSTTITTVRNGFAYVVNFECWPEQAEQGRVAMNHVLAAFSFIK